jgi:hypothetical protein
MVLGLEWVRRKLNVARAKRHFEKEDKKKKKALDAKREKLEETKPAEGKVERAYLDARVNGKTAGERVHILMDSKYKLHVSGKQAERYEGIMAGSYRVNEFGMSKSVWDTGVKKGWIKYDANGDGTISIHEGYVHGCASADFLRKYGKKSDNDGTGVIAIGELEELAGGNNVAAITDGLGLDEPNQGSSIIDSEDLEFLDEK